MIDGRLVHELPLNERNFLAFALLAPGSQLPAEGSQNSTQGGAVSVNGAREQSNNFLLEGVDNNDPYINQYVALPSIDAIQEFKVQSSDYSAEFGRSGGAQINVILKSGSNQFHGGLFEFLRNRNLDAKNFFDLPYCTPGFGAGHLRSHPRAWTATSSEGPLAGPFARTRRSSLFPTRACGCGRPPRARPRFPRKFSCRRIAVYCRGVGIPMNPAGQAILNLYPAANVGPI